MTLRKTLDVICDGCGRTVHGMTRRCGPTGAGYMSAAARKVARGAGFTRRMVGDRYMDLCYDCRWKERYGGSGINPVGRPE